MWTDVSIQELVFYVGEFIVFALGFMTAYRP